IAWITCGCSQSTLSSSENEDLKLVQERTEMVRSQIAARGVRQSDVLEAMKSIPRHEFVPKFLQDSAYEDTPLPIGHGQTISQPYIVAFMTEALKLRPGDRVLEIGTGSGYQAAVLAKLCKEVYTIEIVEPLAQQASATLARLGFKNVHVKAGDGYKGWPEYAPFDAIMVTAAPDHIPEALTEQLGENGRLVIPVGKDSQNLILITKAGGKLSRETILPVRFVPMTGEAEKRSK
ncbi:MAG TPA: protein-L-isoaspartate(D-aspartate) O-methyltransferase, partial [Candidatus Obscuribacterales bacterium]